ncbi:hypothetical protein ITP53_43240 [Nonomuraea sp. K274]|uniref:Uncharacterized protein n=1 Tax=Nonomuraea cypriaca TaxID=1187855 RepID=A0A931AGQ5_9ACTN|nr:hypothetical protein [Nonomuraea cypriaca]MBF8192386.1 hypothetical protein [Nonomuraea cypriaca]
MMDVIASEWHKLRSLRSNAYLLAVSVLAVLACAGVAYMMGRGFDQQTFEERLLFTGNGDGLGTGLPIAYFVLGTLGALTITSEYTTGMIRTSLVAVPRRQLFLFAKVPGLAVVTLVAGQVLAFAMHLAAQAVLGDRAGQLLVDGQTLGTPLSDPGVLASVVVAGLSMTAAALIGLGVGAAIRSTPGEPGRARPDLPGAPGRRPGTAVAAAGAGRVVHVREPAASDRRGGRPAVPAGGGRAAHRVRRRRADGGRGGDRAEGTQGEGRGRRRDAPGGPGGGTRRRRRGGHRPVLPGLAAVRRQGRSPGHALRLRPGTPGLEAAHGTEDHHPGRPAPRLRRGRISTVFSIPGGPDVSGIDDLKQFSARFAKLRNRFDVVSFAPRNTVKPGGVLPYECLSTGPYITVPRDPAEYAALGRTNREHAQRCRAAAPEFFDHMDSASVARDIEAVRAALGEERLSFLANSYARTPRSALTGGPSRR